MADIKTVGIVGAGQMGAGIAHVCSAAGYQVLFHDVTPERIQEGLSLVRRNMTRQVSKGLLTEADMEAALGRIGAPQGVEGMGACDLVIEAATENEEVK